METILHIKEATENERRQWASQIATYWEEIASSLNVKSKVQNAMPSQCNSPLTKAIFFAEYLVGQQDITLNQILLANERICRGYCDKINEMIANIKARRASGLTPDAAASSDQSRQTFEREEDLVRRERMLLAAQDQFARYQLEVKADLARQKQALEQERRNLAHTKSEQDQLISEGWIALHKARMAHDATVAATPVSVADKAVSASTSSSSPSRSIGSFFTNQQLARQMIRSAGPSYVDFASYLASKPGLHIELLNALDNREVTYHVRGRQITGQTEKQCVWNLLDGISTRAIKREQLLEALSKCPAVNLDDPEVKNFLNDEEPSREYGR